MTTYKQLQNALDVVGEVPCQSAPDMFFPVKGEFMSNQMLSYAKKLCTGCPIRQICLDYAVDCGETEGVWGGVGAGQLRDIRRARRQGAPASEQQHDALAS